MAEAEYATVSPPPQGDNADGDAVPVERVPAEAATELRFRRRSGDSSQRGSFGAGGWSPNAKYSGSYPRLDELARTAVQENFRSLLLNRYHTVVRAWRDMDNNEDGRLSFYEFMRACQKLGVDTGAREVWEALDVDHSGFVTLDEVDPDLSNLLGNLAVCIWATCRNLDVAWKQLFNKQGRLRIVLDDFVRGCECVKFPGDASTAFQALRSDMAATGLRRQEFDFLELWFVRRSEPVSPFHKEAENTGPDEIPLPGRTAVKAESRPKQQFKELLLKSYGNILRAWRQCLDRDGNGMLDFKEFSKACADVGYAGSRRELWTDLDADNNGGVSLKEIDRPVAVMIDNMLACVRKRHSSWHIAWSTVIDPTGTDRVERRQFSQACGVLGYGGNANRLFELLDLDMAKYLSFASTAWLDDFDASKGRLQVPAVLGDLQVGSQYSKSTTNSLRLADAKGRDQRLKGQRASQCSRREVANIRFEDHRRSIRSTFARSDHAASIGDGQTSPNETGMSEGYGEENDGGLPDWLRALEGSDNQDLRLTTSNSTKKNSRVSSPLTRSLPLPPVAGRFPGKGGWPGSRLRLVDPVWGAAALNSSPMELA
eukprot:CAMPEP_0172804822 /NCGR_PEP_ID=MMETSP1075-20121228/5434_1 /TAXON_ID=2916 /ORGANISM="Ceratium fusus, Strain PA161109" /LENGTH=597 /DNA_ID=CAMNT_0013643475 /DNA_START=25 /DNA_END=1814 /DNA_ORIENTATION=-